jgi:glycosyltransferase involved in cell wall biosynthesis
MFSIIIPSWNNLPYLKLCIESITKNSFYKHQIIVHVNDGCDGTLAYLKNNNINYSHSDTNIGICFAVNAATHLAKENYIVYMNDDMYVCPNWDKIILDEINLLDDDNFIFSGTLIEPKDTGNACVVVKDFGQNIEAFKEEELLNTFDSLYKADWNGSAWPPTIVSKRMWLYVGGYSTEFSPGMSSDDDFAMKMWHAGCRIFKGIGASKIYHFQAKSTHRIVKNNGRKQFLFKWGINQSTFNKYFIQRGTPYSGKLSDNQFENIINKEVKRAKIKKLFWTFK